MIQIESVKKDPLEKILILGYYDKHNLGDQAYQTAFSLLLPNRQLVFANPINLEQIPKDISIIVCGGGDIINDWFNDEFQRLLKDYYGTIYAVSIGITYDSTITQQYLGKFSQIYVRHKAHGRELAILKNTDNIYHVPDITFIIPPSPSYPPASVQNKPIIGVFPANGIDIHDQLVPILKSLLENYEIRIYAFNTSAEPHESDVSYIKQYYADFNLGPLLTTPQSMLEEMSKLYFAITVRYHSHIFAIMQHIPFVSIATTTKVKYLLQDNDLHNFYDFFLEKDLNLKEKIKSYLAEPLYTSLKNKLIRIHTNSIKILSNLKLFNSAEKTLDQIHSECQNMLDTGVEYREIASHAIYHITKSVHNKYLYGFIEDLRAAKHNLMEMLKWIHKDSHSKRGIKFLQSIDEYQDIHRSGWEYVVSLLTKLESPSGILTDLYVDGTFHWNEKLYLAQDIIPFKHEWIGFIHHTDSTFNEYNLTNLVLKESFQLSLPYCKGLIVLSSQNKIWLEQNPITKHIPIFLLYHTTEFVPTLFQPFNFTSNPRIVQIGSWLRDPYAIYRMNFQFGKKFILIGKNMENIIHPPSLTISLTGEDIHLIHMRENHINASVSCECCNETFSRVSKGLSNNLICRLESIASIIIQFILRFIFELQAPSPVTVSTAKPKEPVPSLGYHEKTLDVKKHESKIRKINSIIKNNYKSVEQIESLSNQEYDKLLSNSIVFLKLEDCSAVNTIIECIVRNTPIIVNRLPATIEYLGHNYPLLYSSIEEAENFTLKDIQKAHVYLSKMDKTPFTADTFLNGFKNILKHLTKIKD